VVLGTLVHAFRVSSAGLYGDGSIREPAIDVTGLRALTQGTAA
jgi:hypothetical protein